MHKVRKFTPKKTPSQSATIVDPRVAERRDIAEKGEAIYHTQIEPVMTPRDHGKIVAIDVDSGDYTTGRSALPACDKLRKKRPQARIWAVRVGYRAMVRFGGRPLRNGV